MTGLIGRARLELVLPDKTHIPLFGLLPPSGAGDEKHEGHCDDADHEPGFSYARRGRRHPPAPPRPLRRA